MPDPAEHPHAANWRKWIGHLAGRPARGLELGSFRGESADWMCGNVFANPLSVYVCVDHFEGSAEHRAAGIDCRTLELDCRQRLAPYPQAVIVKGRTDAVLPALSLGLAPVIGVGRPRFDFVYVDAAHDARSVLRDAVLAFDLLAVGGVMVFDDYGWAVMPDELDRPRVAIDAFLHCYARQAEVVGRGWQVAVRKVAE